ncbi:MULTISPECIES: hypothetical protein [Clostridium]|jgi:hypothetical protein|uniref:Uncharacterized protein n=1 Tax=Clostridium butyricum TaxID=1492 RepID=A0A2S7FA00_CLOBU|nr:MULTISPECIES: hypothetical protein [Clostridium]ALP89622.1 hypothetical protein ATN24_05595 [Clostridium butyricum]ALS16077.1 hypothetical protein ATD26_04155 [Clostridium butyricum]ANF13235.1 hypothetical protein AZ909_04035 [Clostridium butyricum]AOR93306.1 hypothetical protein BBB49_04220 [Clostridium butyricum]APF22729.1 hypothetical protein NPD4_2974 [Clostridium butyricum]
MKSKIIKMSALICVIISFLSINGCKSNSATNIEKENTNVKDESSAKTDESKNNIILLENEKIASVLSEKERKPELEKALKEKYDLDDKGAKETRYYYNCIDLNGDGVNEIFVEVVGPFTSGTGGDSAVIYKDNNGTLEEISDFTLIRNPIIISDEKSNGWNDIIVEYSGGGAPKKYAILKYDGNKYSKVNESETIDSIKDVSGVAIISNDMEKDMKASEGLYLG